MHLTKDFNDKFEILISIKASQTILFIQHNIQVNIIHLRLYEFVQLCSGVPPGSSKAPFPTHAHQSSDGVGKRMVQILVMHFSEQLMQWMFQHVIVFGFLLNSNWTLNLISYDDS